MVRNRWNESEAQKFKTLLEQRVYSSRLLGQDAELVMHGGGNTSVKGTAKNILGEEEAVLYIKGSGWDLAYIEAAGYPAVRMNHLLKLRRLNELSDPAMVNELRTHLMESKSPDPSVETLLHAFIPHKFVDHTHADAVLTLTNQPNGEALIKELYGDKVGVVPYVMPGFQLAKLCAEVYEKNPKVEGLVLLKHGIFSFGETAKESYDRMIHLVRMAEEFILSKTAKRSAGKRNTSFPVDDEFRANWLQAIRSEYLLRQFPAILQLNDSGDALEFVNQDNLISVATRGPVTPDHVIRTKRVPLVVSADAVRAKDFTSLFETFNQYEKEYKKYFETECKEKHQQKIMLDPLPRVVLVPDVGIITVGKSVKDARIAMDIYEHTTQVIRAAEGMNGYEALPPGDIFDVEYWVLEQAKLALGPKSSPLSGKTALITGGASGIGLAISEELLSQGANVFILDRNDSDFTELKERANKLCKAGNKIELIRTDVTNRQEVKQAVVAAVKMVGGLDIVVVNAGIFPSSASIEDISEEAWRRSMSVNLDGAFYFLSETLRWMKAQKNGGDVILIASKNATAPGPMAGAYSVAKAAQVQLARVCALEGGAHKIRVNMLHPHLIFDTGIWTPEIIEKRAKAYGLTPEEYKKNNLLKTELTSKDVARAAFALVNGSFSKTTGAQIPVDGGSDRTL